MVTVESESFSVNVAVNAYQFLFFVITLCIVMMDRMKKYVVSIIIMQFPTMSCFATRFVTPSTK